MPVMALNTVVLPAPFGPMTDTISLAGTFRSRALTAVSPPKRTVSLLISRMFMACPAQGGVEFSFDLARWEQAFGPESHHENECQPEQHVFPTAGLNEDVAAGDE